MPNVALQDGKVILKDGNVSCTCCGGVVCPDICWNGGQNYPIILGGAGCDYHYSYNSDECDEPGSFVTCYAVNIQKITDTSWFLNGLNFMGPSFGPFFIINEAIGTGPSIFEADWEITGGFSDAPISSMISQPTNGVCS